MRFFTVLIFLSVFLQNSLFAQLGSSESVIYDNNREQFYVTNRFNKIMISPDLEESSELISSDLNSPKGLALVTDDLLAVADGNRVQVFSIPLKQLVLSIPVPGASNLNGMTILDNNIYITDSDENKLFRMPIDGNYTPVEIDLGNITKPTGITTSNNKVYFVSQNGLICNIDIQNNFQINTEKELDDFQKLEGIAFDEGGFCYILNIEEFDYTTIVRFKPDFSDEGMFVLDNEENLSNCTDLYYHRPDNTLITTTLYGYFPATIELNFPPIEPTLISPKDGAIDQPINISVFWTSDKDAETYDLQLSSDANFIELVVDETELTEPTYQISDLNYLTTYYWRTRSVNKNGNGEWSEVWSFMTSDELTEIDPPNLLAPKYAAMNQSKAPEFIWEEDLVYSATYTLQIDLDMDFASSELQERISEESSFESDFDLKYARTYYWRIKKAIEGVESEWSPAGYFSIEPELTEPGLLLPDNQATGIELSPEFTWQGDDVGSYSIAISTSEVFNGSELIIIDNISGELNSVTYEDELKPNTIYYWKLVALSHSLDQLMESETRQFTTLNPASVLLESFKIYPNPTNNFLSIETKNKLDIKIVDLTGKTLIQKTIQGNENLDLSKISKGNYIFNVYDKDKLIKSEKLIIK